MFGQGFLRECLDYDPNIGSLTWRERPRCHFATLNAHVVWNAKHSGKEAGGVVREAGGGIPKGYRRVCINGRWRKAHRVIWEWMTGLVPTEIDHLNGDPSDNRWANLRDVDRLGNERNRKRNANNSTGVAGVYVDKRNGRFQAHISVQSKKHRLGSFTTLEEATFARRAAAQRLGFHERALEPRQTVGLPAAAVLMA